jgi:hypothetical protein
MAYLHHKLYTKDSGDIEVDSFEGGNGHPGNVQFAALKLTPRDAIRLGAMLITCGESVLEDSDDPSVGPCCICGKSGESVQHTVCECGNVDDSAESRGCRLAICDDCRCGNNWAQTGEDDDVVELSAQCHSRLRKKTPKVVS